jgi:cytochrome c peroxidase
MRPPLLIAITLAGCAAEPATQGYAWDLPPGMPVPRVPGDNAMSADKVELGRYLFYDTRLSADGTQACATCHAQARAFTDGLVVPVGITGEHGRRNSMSLVNVAYNSSQTWASDVPTLEAQALLPMFGTSPIELGLSGVEGQTLARLATEPIYAELFPRAFPGTEPFTFTNVTRAIASFERAIVSADSPFDRFVRGNTAAMTEREQRGLELFQSERLGCASCHAGFNLASAVDHEGALARDARFFNTGLYNVGGTGAYPSHDRGLVEVTGNPAHTGSFRAPTLRNIALTAPYFHDGSAQTLHEVVAIYERGGRVVADGPYAGDGAQNPLKSSRVAGFTLTDEERGDLLAFLGTLTDETIVARPDLSSPW